MDPRDTGESGPAPSSQKGDAQWLRAYNRQAPTRPQTGTLSSFRDIGNIVVVQVQSENLCHGDSHRQLKDEIRSYTQGKDHKHLILDLTRVQYVPSTLVGTLLWARQQIQSQGGQSCLCGVHWRVMELLKLCNMDRVMPIQPNLSTSIRWLKEHP
jgi:anti-anti-sigma factor